jgi:hypothetical protein
LPLQPPTQFRRADEDGGSWVIGVWHARVGGGGVELSPIGFIVWISMEPAGDWQRAILAEWSRSVGEPMINDHAVHH